MAWLDVEEDQQDKQQDKTKPNCTSTWFWHHWSYPNYDFILPRKLKSTANC